MHKTRKMSENYPNKNCYQVTAKQLPKICNCNVFSTYVTTLKIKKTDICLTDYGKDGMKLKVESK